MLVPGPATTVVATEGPRINDLDQRKWRKAAFIRWRIHISLIHFLFLELKWRCNRQPIGEAEKKLHRIKVILYEIKPGLEHEGEAA